MEWIDYRQLPQSAGGFSELFYDYVYDYELVKEFYPHNFREGTAFGVAMKALENRQPERSIVANVMREQNKAFGSPPSTFSNITLLEKPSTYAVVTGQQVGLLGGPMYTIYKTITAIKLAERLKLKFPNHDFVPVFWIEGEDHDFAEMNHLSLYDAEMNPTPIAYLPGGVMPEKNPGPVGEMVFDETLLQTLSTVESHLQKTEFTEQVMAKAREAYAVGSTFNIAFARWMNSLFEEYGLVFISSNNPQLKRLLSPIFVREIEEHPKTSQMIIARSAELEQQYHAQLKPRSVNLFLFHKGGRYAIEPREHDFSLKGTRHFLQKDELLRIATETPELLSPNVVLRPLAQDTLLPTVAYVAGPSEVAYHAQLSSVYQNFGIAQPVVYPRASASFVEERVVRVMEKYQIEQSAFFDDIEQVKARVLERIEEVKIDRLFGETAQIVHDALNELRFAIKEIDPTLMGPMDNVKSKFDVNLGVLKEKSLAAQKKRNEVAMRQIEKAANVMLPGGSLQEREINVLHYMNKYGPDLIRWLMGEIDITGFKHQVLSL